MGFLGVIKCGHIEIDQHLITALVERWRPETHTFHFPVGEATVTLQDVAIIWGLPIEGNFITGVDTKWTTQQWQNYCHQFLGFQPDEKALKNSRIKLTVLHEWLLSNMCDSDSPFEEVLQEARFIWTPYGGEGPDVQSLPIYALRTPWHIKCPLIHYAIVEIHHPERVLRQFGMIQDIPRTLRPEIENDRDTVPDYMNWFRQITRIQISHEIESATTPGYRPVNISDADYLAERVGQMIIDYNRVPMDFHSVVQLMTSHHQTHQEIMNFLETRYPLISTGVVPNEAGPSNTRDEAGPSNAPDEAGPSNAYTPTNTAYTVDSDNSYLPFIGDESTYTVTPDHRIYHGISPVPFEDLDVPSQNSVPRQEQVPRRNRRRPRCGTGGITKCDRCIITCNFLTCKMLHK
ncbi:Serine/threonine-protein phosphatase 7 long form [Sesamum angolense]|uniref:Serine/threonine-protein phosphatase 7 long form n=1 Tax=Sesamum angolense TaxID=2727404 RepID=A0AAE2BMQ2_9LAMI|nr:Serine/threonine-protein phosphatase 7 long form [Sesamum angolense]